MKYIKIRNKKYPDPAINWDFQAESEQPKLSELLDSGVCGKPERWVLHKDEPMAEGYDEADVLEERTVEDYPAVDPVLISEAIPGSPAVMDEAGNIVQAEIPEVPAVYSEAIPAKTHKEVKLKAEYTIEIEDITAKVEQEKINAEALAYLASTDWMVVRFAENGTPYPEEVKAERAAARARIVK
jgi:hypothetical protein